MRNQCPVCSHPIGFWEKFNTSRFKSATCGGCGSALTVPSHFKGLILAVFIPVVARYLLQSYGIHMPLWLQLILPIPLLYIIFQYALPLAVTEKTDDEA